MKAGHCPLHDEDELSQGHSGMKDDVSDRSLSLRHPKGIRQADSGAELQLRQLNCTF